MTNQPSFFTNVAIQIGGFFAMLIGGAPILFVTIYINMNVLHYNPIISYPGGHIERQPISIFPLILKIAILIICIVLLVLLVLRGTKARKAVFNNVTRPNLYSYILNMFLQGVVFLSFTGLLGYTLISTLFPTFYSGATP